MTTKQFFKTKIEEAEKKIEDNELTDFENGRFGGLSDAYKQSEKVFRETFLKMRKEINTIRQDVDNTFEGLDGNWITKRTINDILDKFEKENDKIVKEDLGIDLEDKK